MGVVVIEEKYISHDQYLDLVYSHSQTLYYLTPHAPHPTSNPSRNSIEPLNDGILGSVQSQSKAKSSKKQDQPSTYANKTVLNVNTASPPIISTEVNVLQSS